MKNCPTCHRTYPDNNLAFCSTLEEALRRRGFARIHRATLVNPAFVDELHRWFGGRMIARIKDRKRTELTVARNYAGELCLKSHFLFEGNPVRNRLR